MRGDKRKDAGKICKVKCVVSYLLSASKIVDTGSVEIAFDSEQFELFAANNTVRPSSPFLISLKLPANCTVLPAFKMRTIDISARHRSGACKVS